MPDNEEISPIELEVEGRCFWNEIFNPETKKIILSSVIEQAIDKFKEDFRFRNFITDNDLTKLLNHLVKNFFFTQLIEILSEKDLADKFFDSVQSNILEYINSLSNEEILMVEEINREIERQSQRFGSHRELAESSRSSILLWSNAAQFWGIIHRPIKKGEEITLDANVVLVPFSRSKVQKVICLLNESPLFRFSFEAGTKKGRLVTILEAMLKQIESRKFREEQEKFA